MSYVPRLLIATLVNEVHISKVYRTSSKMTGEAHAANQACPASWVTVPPSLAGGPAKLPDRNFQNIRNPGPLAP